MEINDKLFNDLKDAFAARDLAKDAYNKLYDDWHKLSFKEITKEQSSEYRNLETVLRTNLGTCERSIYDAARKLVESQGYPVWSNQ